MPAQIKNLRSSASGNRPLGHVYGELYSNTADLQIGCVDINGQPQDFVAVRFWTTNANYSIGHIVVYNGNIYKALQNILAGNPWIASQWSEIASLADLPSSFLPLTGGTMTGKFVPLYPTTQTEAARVDWVGAELASYMPLSGGTFTGPVGLYGDPTWPEGAANKNYVDNQDATKLSLSGGTMTGSLYPLYTPTLSDVARGDWVRDYVSAGYLPLAGGTINGNVNIYGKVGISKEVDATIFSASNYVYGSNYVQSGGYSYATSGFQGPNLGGGIAGAGWLLGMNQSNNIAFQWNSPSISFNIDNAYSQRLVYSIGAQGPQQLNIQSSGGPTNLAFTFYGPSASGTVFSCYIDATSDARIKENIQDSKVDALSIVTKLKIREFDYTDDHLTNLVKSLHPVLPLPTEPQMIRGLDGLSPPTDEMIADHRRNVEQQQEQQKRQDEAIANIHLSKHHRIGMVTQEVKELIPEMVDEIEDLQHIVYKNAVPYLIKAIQQLTAKVADLEQQLAMRT